MEKYTKKEIELYEGLAKIKSVHNDMMKIITQYLHQIIDVDEKWAEDLLEKTIIMRDILRETKIPDKFLILNSLK